MATLALAFSVSWAPKRPKMRESEALSAKSPPKASHCVLPVGGRPPDCEPAMVMAVEAFVLRESAETVAPSASALSVARTAKETPSTTGRPR